MPGFSSLKMPPWLMWWKLAPSRQPPSVRKADLEAGAQDRVAAKVLAVAVEIKRRPRLEPDVDVLVGQDKVVGTGGVEDGAAVVGRRRADHGTEAVDAPRRRVLEAAFDGLIFVFDQIESADTGPQLVAVLIGLEHVVDDTDADRINGHAGDDPDGRFGLGRTRRGKTCDQPDDNGQIGQDTHRTTQGNTPSEKSHQK